VKTKTKTTQRQMLNWLLDAGIFIAFLLAFFLNLTGLEVHQLIGAAISAAALLHLVLHFDWVKTMTARLFGSAPARQKIYYALDGDHLSARSAVRKGAIVHILAIAAATPIRTATAYVTRANARNQQSFPKEKEIDAITKEVQSLKVIGPFLKMTLDQA
jgi:hypothetical protein